MQASKQESIITDILIQSKKPKPAAGAQALLEGVLLG